MDNLFSESLWTEQDLSKFLKKSPRSLQGWRYSGDGPQFIKLGRAIRYRKGDVLKWLESNVLKSTSSRPK